MNDNSRNETFAGGATAQATEKSKKEDQGTRQPADEEIGDYADPDAIQVDGGDNSFIADQPEEAPGAKKKSDAK